MHYSLSFLNGIQNMLKNYFISELIFISIIFTTLHAQKVIYLEQSVRSSGEKLPQPVTMLVKTWFTDDNIRSEQPGQIVLTDIQNKKIYNLIPEKKQYMEISFEEMQQLFTLNQSMTRTKDPVKFKRSGITKKINSWNTYQLVSESAENKIEIWLSEDISTKREKLINMYKSLPGMSGFFSVVNNLEGFKGFPVLMISQMNMMSMEVLTEIEDRKSVV